MRRPVMDADVLPAVPIRFPSSISGFRIVLMYLNPYRKARSAMSLELSVQSAISLEGKIRDLYIQSHKDCKDEAGKRFFAMLRDDEQYHMDYLRERLGELKERGEMQHPDIKTRVPPATEIASCVADAEKHLSVEDRGVLQQILSNALRVEVRTSEFYTKMVSDSEGDVKGMFARFLEIENSHIAAVQAELDYVMNTGYWFGIKEFDME
jgi:rubrerythrin